MERWRLSPCCGLVNQLMLAGCVLLVAVPSDVRAGHPLCDDDPDQLVSAGHLGQHRHLRRQPRRHVGQDHLVLARRRHIPVDNDSPSRPPRQGLRILDVRDRSGYKLHLHFHTAATHIIY